MKRLPVLLALLASPLAAQEPSPPPKASPPAAAPGSPPFRLPVKFAGEATSSAEFYHAGGIPSRRPGQSGRLSFTPQVTLFGEFGMSVNLVLSSEGSDVRQNISQLGLNPRYKWVTLHLGDFSQNYSGYTIEGTRVRGAGFDLRPGIFRFSAQGGRSQRTVAAGPGNLAYRRNLFAAQVGMGRDAGTFIDFTMVRARDDISSLAPALTDTTLLDTIPVTLRPRIATRPQENLVVGTRGALGLFHRRVNLKGEIAGALITRDLESPDANPGSVDNGSALNSVMPLRLSTSGDLAYRADVDANLGAGGLRAAYEYVGAGYTSLGLAYLISDRRAYDMGGNLRLARGRMSLLGQYRHQEDNLLDQKIATTNLDALTGTVVVSAGRGFSTSLTAFLNTTANDAAVDTFRVDNRAFSLSASSSFQAGIAGRTTTTSLSYALQRTADQNVITRIPDVTVHNFTTAIQVPLSKVVSVAPSGSFAITVTPARPTQRNVYVGFRGQAKHGKTRVSLSATQTFSNSRGVFGVNGQITYPLPWQGRLSVQVRHSRYAAIGNRPAFNESFATLSLARSF